MMRAFLLFTLIFSANCLPACEDDAEKVNQLIAAIKARGEPLTRSEVEQRHPQLPSGVEDVSKIWLKGMAPMGELSYFERQPPIPPYLLLIGKKHYPLPYEDWPDLDRVEQHLKEYQSSIAEFHEAARRGGYGKIDRLTVWNERSDAIGLFGNINAANLLTLDVVAQSRKGDAKACARSLSAAMLLGRALKNNPGIIGQTSFTASDESSAKALAQVLCITSFTSDELAAYRTILDSRDKEDTFGAAMIEQRVINYLNLKEPLRSPFSRPPPQLSDADWLLFFEGSERLITNARKPFPDRIDEAEKFLEELKSRINATPSPPESTLAALRTLRTYTMELWYREYANYLIANRAADTGIAIELYRRDNGKLPDSLERLVPKYLTRIPLDPFSGKNLLYKREKNGFTLYGLGKNRKHDDGKLDPKEADSGLFFPITSKAN